MPRKTAIGIDKLTRDQTIKHFNWLINKELTDIHEMKYEAKPVRRAFIPKTDGGERPLGVPCVMDRS